MPSCQQIKQEYSELKSLFQELDSEFQKAGETGDFNKVKKLKAELEIKKEALSEKLWPFKELPQKELKKQYEQDKEILRNTGILEKLSTGELGVVGIDNQKYPFPELSDIFKMMKKNREVIKTKIEQGFTKLLITPFGMKLDDLAERYKQAILKHYQEGKLFATKKNQDDPNEPLIPLELNESNPLWKWEEYNNADVSGKLIYNPEQLPTTDEEPDEKKRRQKSKGKTKKEILAGGDMAGHEGQAYGAGWDIQLTEDMPNIPRANQGKTIEGRPQLDTAGSSIKEYIKKGENIPSSQEYLKAIQSEPIYQHEQGMTPEDQITYAILHLEQTNQVIDDWGGHGSISYQLRAYFPVAGVVPGADWYRGYRRASMGRFGPVNRDVLYGVRSGVRVKKA